MNQLPYYCPNCLKEHTSADFPTPCGDCPILDSDAETSFSSITSECMKQARERAKAEVAEAYSTPDIVQKIMSNSVPPLTDEDIAALDAL